MKSSIMCNILYLEDNYYDIELFKETLDLIDYPIELDCVTNGSKAMEYLENHTDLPNLILSDLKMPVMSGHDFLRIIKKDPRFNHIPVIIFSTSDNIIDIQESYKLQASSYMTKPINFNELTTKINLLFDFYFKVVNLP